MILPRRARSQCTAVVHAHPSFLTSEFRCRSRWLSSRAPATAGPRPDPTLLQDQREYYNIIVIIITRGPARTADFVDDDDEIPTGRVGRARTKTAQRGTRRYVPSGDPTTTSWLGYTHIIRRSFLFFFSRTHNNIIIISLRFSILFYVALHIITFIINDADCTCCVCVCVCVCDKNVVHNNRPYRLYHVSLARSV